MSEQSADAALFAIHFDEARVFSGQLHKHLQEAAKIGTSCPIFSASSF
jgi:hypothetical protein